MTTGTELVRADGRFDYDSVPAELVAPLQKQGSRIREHVRAGARVIFEIGRDLLAVKRQLPHGQFGDWVVAECGFSHSTACNYMKAAELANSLPADKFATVGNLPERTLYRLAARSTPTEVVTDVLSRIERGEKITEDQIKALKTEKRCEQALNKKQADRNFKRTKAQRDRGAAREVKAKERELAARHRARVLAEEVISIYGTPTVSAILEAFHAEIYFEDAVRRLASPVEGRTKPPVEILAKPADAAMAKSRRVVPLSSDRIRAIADRAVADQEKKHAAKEAKTSETVAESGIAVGTIDGSAVTTVGDPGPMPSFLKIGSPDCWRNKIAADAVSGNPATGTVHCAPQPVRAEMAGQA